MGENLFFLPASLSWFAAANAAGYILFLQKRTVSGAGSAKSSAPYEEYPQAKHEKGEQYKKNGCGEYGEHDLKILVKGTHRLCRLFQTPFPK
jgi:hypothetical protein